MQRETGKAKPHENCLRTEQLETPSAVPCVVADYSLSTLGATYKQGYLSLISWRLDHHREARLVLLGTHSASALLFLYPPEVKELLWL